MKMALCQKKMGETVRFNNFNQYCTGEKVPQG